MDEREIQALVDGMSRDNLATLVSKAKLKLDDIRNKELSDEIDSGLSFIHNYEGSTVKIEKEDDETLRARVDIKFRDIPTQTIEIDAYLPNSGVGRRFSIITSVGDIVYLTRTYDERAVVSFGETIKTLPMKGWTTMDTFVLITKVVETFGKWFLNGILKEKEEERENDLIEERRRNEQSQGKDFTQQEYQIYDKLTSLLTSDKFDDFAVEYKLTPDVEQCTFSFFKNETLITTEKVEYYRLYRIFAELNFTGDRILERHDNLEKIVEICLPLYTSEKVD